MNFNEFEKCYHIGLSKEDIKGAKYAILPGDPARVEIIASYLENAYPLTNSREYTSFLGEINGEKVLVISTGMGGPSTAICVEELASLGIENLIRVGTCGGMQMDVVAGDLVIASSAIRQEGTSKEYAPIEFPAVADINIVNALRKSTKNLKFKSHTGTVHCKDSFYGQHSPEKMPISYELQEKWQAWIKAGALASEMETASLFVVASYLRLRAGAVLTVVWNQERENAGFKGEKNLEVDNEIKVAIEAIRILIEEENE